MTQHPDLEERLSHGNKPVLWHYTIGGHYFDDIRIEGILRRSDGLLDADEVPVVWFTTRDSMDPTVSPLSAEETARQYNGLVRIGVLPEVAPYGWTEWKRKSGVSAKTAARLFECGRKRGVNPKQEWYVSFSLVPKEEWETVEVLKDGNWVDEAAA